MKKFLSVSVLIILLSVFLSNTALSKGVTVNIGNNSTVYQGTLYNLELNGVWIPTETPCIVVAGVAYVPLREVFQDYLGLTVGYDNQKEMAYVQSGSNKMEFSFKQQTIYQNGKKIEPALPVASINGNTMVPLSKTAAFFGYTVSVKSDNKTLTIQWNNKTENSAIIKDTPVSGSVKKISYYPDSGKEIIFIETTAKEISKHFVLKPMEGNPYYRLCVQFGTALIEKPGNLDVYAGSVQQIRFAQAEKNISNVVIEVDHDPKYTVNVVQNGIEIAIVSNKTAENSAPAASPEPTQAPRPTPTPVEAQKPAATPTPTPTPTTTPAPTPAPSKAPNPTPAPTPQQVGNGVLKYTMEGNDCVLWIDGIDIQAKIKESPDLYQMEYRSVEKILQIRMPFSPEFKTEVLPGNSLLYGVISYSNNLKKEVSIRISGREELSYVVASNGSNGTKIIFKGSGEQAQVPAPTPAPVAVQPSPTPEQQKPTPMPTPAQQKPSPAPTPVQQKPSPAPTPVQQKPSPAPAQPTPAPTQAPDLASRGDANRSGTVSYIAGSDKIIIEALEPLEYKIFRLSSPSRIVIDIYQNVIDSKEFEVPAGRLYTKIRTGQFEKTTARIVLEAPADPDWDVKKDGNVLTVNLKPSGIKNMTFNNDGNNAILILSGTDLKRKIEQNQAQIRIDDDKNSKVFSFIIPSDIIDLGSGRLQTGDKLMKSVQTLTSGKSAFLVIERENANIGYQFRFTSSGNEVIIEPASGASNQTPTTGNNSSPTPAVTPAPIVTPTPTAPKTGGKLVVLDAGHGGHDPGANYGKDEKWYNLDITLRVEKLLKDKGVNVKLTRSTDVFVGLDERAIMANNWNADLFVSIHNNAFFDKNISGTMTFFYTGSYAGKAYATIIQNDLLRNLGSKDLGVKNNEFVVIKKTKMPAVLVEIGCLTNEEERNKLDTEAYRQKAAESLAESIIKILSQ